jgi:hypothetical protein
MFKTGNATLIFTFQHCGKINSKIHLSELALWVGFTVDYRFIRGKNCKVWAVSPVPGCLRLRRETDNLRSAMSLD